MKKLYICAAIAFVSGVAAGVTGAWAYVNKKAQEDFDAKLDSVRKEYKRYYTEKTDAPDESIPEETSDQTQEVVEKTEDVNSYQDIASSYSNPIDYTSYTPSVVESSADPEEEAKEASDILPKPNDPTRPSVITEDDYFYYSEGEMTQLDIWFFKTEDGDVVLTDDTFDPLDEPYKVITKEDLDAFASQEDTDEIYTICTSRDCVYSICKQAMSWEEFLSTHPVILDTRY